MAVDRRSASIVKAIVTFARASELRVVAEGVDTEPQHQLLRDCRCVEVQGYLYSRPPPYEDFAALRAGAPPMPGSGAGGAGRGYGRK